MRRSIVALGLAWMCSAGVCGSARAQGNEYYPTQRTRRYSRSATTQQPAVSPYLNLLRTDVPPGVNYLTLVRPQMDQAQAAGAAANRLQAPLSANVTSTRHMNKAGHVSRFMDYSGYFFRKGAREY